MNVTVIYKIKTIPWALLFLLSGLALCNFDPWYEYTFTSVNNNINTFDAMFLFNSNLCFATALALNLFCSRTTAPYLRALHEHEFYMNNFPSIPIFLIYFTVVNFLPSLFHQV
jgi:hypothetical protein